MVKNQPTARCSWTSFETSDCPPHQTLLSVRETISGLESLRHVHEHGPLIKANWRRWLPIAKVLRNEARVWQSCEFTRYLYQYGTYWLASVLVLPSDASPTSFHRGEFPMPWHFSRGLYFLEYSLLRHLLVIRPKNTFYQDSIPIRT